MTLTQKIINAIQGQSYLGETGLADYHAAQAVKAALRRKNLNDRLSGVREALNRYRVTAWLTIEGDGIELRRDNKPVLTL